MLILTRRAGESVYIGDDVKVTLMEVKGSQIRLGIDAPSSVKIYREEIYLQILAENQSAEELSRAAPPDLGEIARAWNDQKPQTLSEFQVAVKKQKKK